MATVKNEPGKSVGGLYDYSHTTAVLLFSGGAFALAIANAVFFDRARRNCDTISTGTAELMFWLNVILAVVFGILFFWTIAHYFVSSAYRPLGPCKPEITQETTGLLSPTPSYAAPQGYATPQGYVTPGATAGQIQALASTIR